MPDSIDHKVGVEPFPTWRRLWTSTFSIGEIEHIEQVTGYSTSTVYSFLQMGDSKLPNFMQLETTRLTICLAERQHLTVDPRELLEIFNSNPDFIADSLAQDKHRFTLDEVRAWQFFNGPDRPNQRYFTLRLKPGEELIGFGDLLTPHPRRPLAALGLLILHRDWQGRGLGPEAALAIERQLAQEHWPEIELVVQHSRQRSRCFWESLGYTLVGDDISESGLQSWILRKSLSPEMS